MHTHGPVFYKGVGHHQIHRIVDSFVGLRGGRLGTSSSDDPIISKDCNSAESHVQKMTGHISCYYHWSLMVFVHGLSLSASSEHRRTFLFSSSSSRWRTPNKNSSSSLLLSLGFLPQSDQPSLQNVQLLRGVSTCLNRSIVDECSSIGALLDSLQCFTMLHGWKGSNHWWLAPELLYSSIWKITNSSIPECLAFLESNKQINHNKPI